MRPAKLKSKRYPVDLYPRSFRTHPNSDDSYPNSADSHQNSSDSNPITSLFTCTQLLLDSCHIECKYRRQLKYMVQPNHYNLFDWTIQTREVI